MFSFVLTPYRLFVGYCSVEVLSLPFPNRCKLAKQMLLNHKLSVKNNKTSAQSREVLQQKIVCMVVKMGKVKQ
jgi:hypothetical protein